MGLRWEATRAPRLAPIPQAWAASVAPGAGRSADRCPGGIGVAAINPRGFGGQRPLSGLLIWVFMSGRLGGFGFLVGALILEAIAAAIDGDGWRVRKEAVEDGAGGGPIAQALAPIFDGSITGPMRGACFA